jgi:hypothetical protein
MTDWQKNGRAKQGHMFLWHIKCKFIFEEWKGNCDSLSFGLN